MDFININTTVTFVPHNSSNQEVCINIAIARDDRVEDAEEFVVSLNTSDSAISFLQSTASIVIEDSSSKFLIIFDDHVV